MNRPMTEDEQQEALKLLQVLSSQPFLQLRIAGWSVICPVCGKLAVTADGPFHKENCELEQTRAFLKRFED
jgi:hypothetical protein